MVIAASGQHRAGAGSLPAPFDPVIYRHANPDLSSFSELELAEHYEAFGRDEGRVCSSVSGRLAFLELFRLTESKLEIGPFDVPLFRDDGTHYADVLDSDGLRSRATELARNPAGVPNITWVIPNGDLSVISTQYDLVASAHAIEHTPDLVAHLAQVSALLNPGGRYALIIPDRRFCFDQFLAPTTIASVLQASLEKRCRHTLESFLEHRALTTHNDPVRHWMGDHGQQVTDPETLSSLLMEYASSEGYLDVHAWKFDPQSFGDLLQLLQSIGRTELVLERVYPTIRNDLEFFAVLRKPGA